MKVVHIDELADVCGYFTTQTDANNHYGCNHPGQEEFEMMHRDKDGYTYREDRDPKVKQGMCYAWSCPLATECDLQDLKGIHKKITRNGKIVNSILAMPGQI